MPFAAFLSARPWPALLLSLVGLAWSLLLSFNLAPESVCFSSGCAALQDFKLYGISPWWAAAFIFGLTTLLCALRLRLFARLLAGLFLLGDCLFLAAMLFIAPCANCLVAALLIFLVWLLLAAKQPERLARARRCCSLALAGIWLALFTLNLGAALNEALPAWTLESSTEEAGAEKTKLALYFSPTCPACREALRLFSDRATLFPVAENEEDYPIIADMVERLSAGAKAHEALEYILEARAKGIWQAPVLSTSDLLSLKLRSLRNAAALQRLRLHALPALVFEGLPKSWLVHRQEQLEDTGQSPPASPELPLGDETLECGPASSRENCE